MAKVKIYKTHTCPFCRMESEFLTEKGVAFDEVFVDDDFKQATEMMNISGQMGVPFTVIKKDGSSPITILGFDKTKLDEVLEIVGVSK